LELFQALVQTQLTGLDYHSLVSKLMAPVLGGNGDTNSRATAGAPSEVVQLHKQAYHSSAKCIAALTQQCPQVATPLATKLITDLQKRNDTEIIFCLLTIGEIGRHFDLSSRSVLTDAIEYCGPQAAPSVGRDT